MPEHDLGTLLKDAVSDVEPVRGVDEIQARTSGRRRRSWAWAAVATVAATAATVAAVTVVTDRSPQAEPPPAGTPSSDVTPTTVPNQPTETPHETPTDEPSTAPSTSSVAIPVYYVGDTPAGPRLFREFGTSSALGTFQRMLDAVGRAVAGDALDPDYASGWPAGTQVDGVGTSRLAPDPTKTLTVGLFGTSDLSARPAGMSEAEARLAIQQVVYTMQAVRQERLAVEFDDAQGNPYQRLLGVDVSRPVTNDPEMQVQAPVWIIDPAEGDTVGPTFTVDGRGAFFEANVSWRLLQGERVVKHGFTTAAEGMTLSPYSFTVKDVPPGDYTLRVFDADMSGGDSGGTEQQDTKSITVR